MTVTAVILREQLAVLHDNAITQQRPLCLGGFLALGSVPHPSDGMGFGCWEGKLGVQLTKHKCKHFLVSSSVRFHF